MRVLVVEDSPRVGEVVGAALRAAGHSVTCVGTVRGGKEVLARLETDLAIIDVGLPDGSGLDLCRAARKDAHDLPILVLTARDEVGDRVAGLDAGADDYLGKPFATAELVARVRALGRRGPRWTESVRTFGAIVIDRDKRVVMRDETPVALTPREFDIVALLAWRDGRVVPKDEILEVVWGETGEGRAQSLEVLVARVRRKLGSPAEDVVRTVRNVGYSWALARSNRP